MLNSVCLQAQIIVKDSFSPQQLVNDLLLSDTSGMQIQAINYTGSSASIGAFYSGTSFLPITKGIVLCTGNAQGVDGPNSTGNHGSIQSTPGSKALQKIARNTTSDAAILEYTFVPKTNRISFVFFFGSEEYPEFVGRGVNDVFAFFIEGPGFNAPYNMARIPENGDPVTIDHVNANKNSNYYRQNILFSEAGAENLKKAEVAYSFQYDGYTIAMEAQAKVNPYQRYKITMAIADAGDNVYDSGVFLKAHSLKSAGETISMGAIYESDEHIQELEAEWCEFKITGTLLNITTRIEFEFNSHLLLDEYHDEMDLLTAIFRRYYDKKIEIIGHTDDVGPDEFNKTLSYERARSISKYLIDNGIDEHRIKLTGKGKTEPVTAGKTENLRQKNRRVEFVLY